MGMDKLYRCSYYYDRRGANPNLYIRRRKMENKCLIRKMKMNNFAFEASILTIMLYIFTYFPFHIFDHYTTIQWFYIP